MRVHAVVHTPPLLNVVRTAMTSTLSLRARVATHECAGEWHDPAQRSTTTWPGNSCITAELDAEGTSSSGRTSSTRVGRGSQRRTALQTEAWWGEVHADLRW